MKKIPLLMAAALLASVASTAAFAQGTPAVSQPAASGTQTGPETGNTPEPSGAMSTHRATGATTGSGMTTKETNEKNKSPASTSAGIKQEK
jgi:hypothetical protein